MTLANLHNYIRLTYNRVRYHDEDSVLLLTGDEGKGKSNLGLTIVDWWYRIRNGEVVKSDIKHMCLDLPQFLEDLKDMKKYECTNYDEAGDISSKRVMSGINVAVTKAYQVIRGDNLLTILTLPSPFDLDGFFTKRRARGLIHVTARGKFEFYSRQRLRRIIELNQNRTVKKINIIPPTFTGTFPKYDGILAGPYLKKKQEKMRTIRQKLYDEIYKSKPKATEVRRENNDLIVKSIGNIGMQKTSEIFDIPITKLEGLIQRVRRKDGLL